VKRHKNQHKQRSNGERNPDQKKIGHRAYELYPDRGGDPGHDCDDWLRAELELKEQGKAARSKVFCECGAP
jgi:hypothetical protein